MYGIENNDVKRFKKYKYSRFFFLCVFVNVKEINTTRNVYLLLCMILEEQVFREAQVYLTKLQRESSPSTITMVNDKNVCEAKGKIHHLTGNEWHNS